MSGSVQAERLETVLLVPSAEMPHTSSEKTMVDQTESGATENLAIPEKVPTDVGNFYLKRTFGYTGSKDAAAPNAVRDGHTTIDELMAVAESFNGQKFLATEFVNLAFAYPRSASKHRDLYGFGSRHTVPKDGEILYSQSWEIATAWDPCEDNCEDAKSEEMEHYKLNHDCFTREDAEVDPVDFVKMLASETVGRNEYDEFQKAKASWFRIYSGGVTPR
jgi:hypothetical protein